MKHPAQGLTKYLNFNLKQKRSSSSSRAQSLLKMLEVGQDDSTLGFCNTLVLLGSSSIREGMSVCVCRARVCGWHLDVQRAGYNLRPQA